MVANTSASAERVNPSCVAATSTASPALHEATLVAEGVSGLVGKAQCTTPGPCPDRYGIAVAEAFAAAPGCLMASQVTAA